jgi:4'-phosphopantetheinyl transferase EntD
VGRQAAVLGFLRDRPEWHRAAIVPAQRGKTSQPTYAQSSEQPAAQSDQAHRQRLARVMFATTTSHLPQPSELTRSLFPEGVRAAEMRGPADPALLSADERRCVERAAPKRVQEFAAGRLCAHRALAELGIHHFALLSAPDRLPLWPAAAIGSISHTQGYCAAVVGLRAQFAGLGLDTESSSAVGTELWSQICTEWELEQLQGLPTPWRVRAASLIFSAKEAFYKCQYPITAEWLEFADIRIEPESWQLDEGRYEVHHARPLQLQSDSYQSMHGRFRFHDGLVSAGFALVGLVVPKHLEGRQEQDLDIEHR